MKASIYDIAERAGVSISTVSRIMNGSAKVSEKKKIAVEEAMVYFDYEPNQFARGLVKQKSNLVGVYLPTPAISLLENKYYLEILKGVEDVMAYHNYSPVLLADNMNSENRTKSIPKCLEYVKQRKVDGLIVGGLSERNIKDQIFDKLIDEDFPLVYIGKRFHQNGYNVYAHFEEYNIQMIRILYENGHRRILYITSNFHKQYIKHISDVLKREMPDIAIKDVDSGKLSTKGDLYECIQKYVIIEECTAVCSPEMMITRELHSICAQTGIKVPEQLSILSTEHELGDGKSLYPENTVFYVPARDMGRGAAELLLKQINHEDIEEASIEYETQYIERNTIRQI